jgi:serine/threonine protein kinase
MTLERGTLLNNRYRVVEILGQGGMGSVYRAVDENLGVEVALKENLFTTDEYARQFRREAVILATLRHPNLTRVTDHFVIEGQGQYLVMDYIEGEDLRQRMDRVGVLNEEEVVIIGAAICDALAYLHTRTPPIVHRDIKPGNVKITPNGQIYLVDFGLAKIIQTGQATTTGARAMTPGYSPPEQYGTARTDSRSDLFSLGATLYAALTGAIPEDALARAMDQAELTTLRKRNSRISRRLASVIERSLAVRPDDRFQTADEFKQALLSVRGITTKRKMGDFTVAPPPGGNGLPSYANEPPSSPLPADFVPVPRNRSPLPLQSSTPVIDMSGAVVMRSRRRANWTLVLMLAVLLAVAGLMAYTLYPSWPTQAMALLFPARGLPESPLVAATATPDGISVVAALSPTLSPTASPTQQVLPTATSSPTTRPINTAVPPAPTNTPTPVPTPVGGGTGQIAFASDRSGTTQIWLMNVDGSGEAQQLTTIEEGGCQPDWSPDGTRLVFISPCDKNQEEYRGSGLWLVNVDGTGLMPLPNVPGGDFDPSWSPDGKKIVFTSIRNTGRTRVYVIDLETNEVTRLSQQYSYDRQPVWSPDGSRIAFVTTQKGPVQIWTMAPDGSDQRLFTRSADAVNSYPTWGVNGEVILFTQVEQSGGIPALVAGSYNDNLYSEFRFDLGPTPAREARYSPDGLWLVFEGWPSGSNHDIYLISASGAGRVRLTTWERIDFDPAWRPVVAAP